jgi:predicted glutamine amidotransferase
MCGLTYYHKTNQYSVSKSVLKRYEAQKSRGSEGFGLVAFNLGTKEIALYHREASEKEMIKKLHELRKSPLNAILFHHRFPTSTINIPECSHPILVDNPELEHVYYVAHNGVISNDDTLKVAHEKLGYKYTTEITLKENWTCSNGQKYVYPKEVKFNDSEAVAIELARRIEGKSDSVEAKGSMALIALQVTRDGIAKALYYGRNYANPLFLELDGEAFCLKSVGDTKDSVEPHKLYRFDYETSEITEQKCDFGYNYAYDNSKYPVGFSTVNNDDEPTESLIQHAPKVSALQYFKQASVTDCSIQAWLSEGATLEDIQDFALEEFNQVDEILEWETMLQVDKNMINRLENRRKTLDSLLDTIDSRITDQYNGLDYQEELDFQHEQ